MSRLPLADDAPSVGFFSHWVPADLIRSCGVRPIRLVPSREDGGTPGLPMTGACPFARAAAGQASGQDGMGVIFATTCDQMRRAAEFAARRRAQVFLLNVPATVNRPGALKQYTAELRRLRDWLQRLSGRALDEELLLSLLRRRHEPSPRRLPRRHKDAVPLAVLGPHLMDDEAGVLHAIADAGGFVALDGLENGPRSRPRASDRRQPPGDAVGELAANCFCGLVDAFRRPDEALFRWLVRACRAGDVAGVVVLHYVWCDPWAALAERIGNATGLPVVELELTGEPGDAARVHGRVSVLVEVLRDRHATRRH